MKDFHAPLGLSDRYDPETNRWTLVAPMSVARLGAGVAACGDVLYVVGGFDGENRWRSAERYHPETNFWQPVGAMATERSGLGKWGGGGRGFLAVSDTFTAECVSVTAPG